MKTVDVYYGFDDEEYPDPFEEFLDREMQSDSEEVLKIQREKRKQIVENLKSLYDIVEESLKPYIENGQITITKTPRQIYEEEVGYYTIDDMEIKLGNRGKSVTLKPIGFCEIIGAEGRVDLEGPQHVIRIVLMHESKVEESRKASGVGFISRKTFDLDRPKEDSSPLVWTFASEPPQIEYEMVTYDGIQNAIMYACIW